MKHVVFVICRLPFKDIYIGKTLEAVYTYSPKHKEHRYHIGVNPLALDVFQKHFDVIGEVTEDHYPYANKPKTMQLHELLKKAREDKGLSVYKLSAITGLSDITIHNIEKNLTNGNIDSITKLIKALDINLLITKDGDFKTV